VEERGEYPFGGRYELTGEFFQRGEEIGEGAFVSEIEGSWERRRKGRLEKPAGDVKKRTGKLIGGRSQKNMGRRTIWTASGVKGKPQGGNLQGAGEKGGDFPVIGRKAERGGGPQKGKEDVQEAGKRVERKLGEEKARHRNHSRVQMQGIRGERGKKRGSRVLVRKNWGRRQSGKPIEPTKRERKRGLIEISS